MKVKSLGANKTELSFTRNGIDIEVLVSYETPVAAIVYDGTGAIKTAKDWSKTTSRHVNQWLKLKDRDPEKAHERSQSWFDKLLG